MIWFKRFLTACAALSLLLVIGFFTLAPQWVDRNANVVTGGQDRHPLPRHWHCINSCWWVIYTPTPLYGAETF
jgi:hypothetical protein